MQINLLEVLINIALATLGGLVRRLSELERKPKIKVTFCDYFIHSFISMFVGIVIYFLCKNFNISLFLTASITALSGYMGTSVLELLSDIAKKRIQKEAGVAPENKKKD